MAPPVVHVLAGSRSLKRQVSRALVPAGLQVLAHGDAAQVASSDGRTALVVLDGDGLGDRLEATLRTVEQAPGVRAVILISETGSPETVADLLSRTGVGNVLAKNGTVAPGGLDEHELLVTCLKLLSRDIFGVDKYISAWGCGTHTAEVASLLDKHQAISAFEAFVRALDVPQGVIPGMVTTADEMILNALVHAPHGPDGKPRFEEQGLSPDIQLEEHEKIRVSWACNGRRLMISVEDPFGRLAKETVRSYLVRGLTPRKLEVSQKASGAGLGLTMSAQSIHNLVFNVQEHVRTEVIAGWSLHADSVTDFRKTPKSLHLFWLPEESEITDCALPVPQQLRGHPSQRP